MAVSNEIEAQIMRYFHVEKWKVGTIARQLGIHQWETYHLKDTE